MLTIQEKAVLLESIAIKIARAEYILKDESLSPWIAALVKASLQMNNNLKDKIGSL